MTPDPFTGPTLARLPSVPSRSPPFRDSGLSAIQGGPWSTPDPFPGPSLAPLPPVPGRLLPFRDSGLPAIQGGPWSTPNPFLLPLLFRRLLPSFPFVHTAVAAERPPRRHYLLPCCRGSRRRRRIVASNSRYRCAAARGGCLQRSHRRRCRVRGCNPKSAKQAHTKSPNPI